MGTKRAQVATHSTVSIAEIRFGVVVVVAVARFFLYRRPFRMRACVYVLRSNAKITAPQLGQSKAVRV